jgi:endoglucanase
MGHRTSRQILTEILSIPTAPFHEGMVIDFVLELCDEFPSLKVRRDSAGNILIHYKKGAGKRKHPVCLTAHLDHPGFVSLSPSKDGVVSALWQGGVHPEYFVGSGVRFWTGQQWVKGKIESISTKNAGSQKKVATATVRVRGDVPKSAIGMWDFPDPRIKKEIIHARGCDDLAGAAAILSAMTTLAAKRVDTEAYYLFTRAEEVGFVGAIAASKLRTIPRRCVVVAIETSSELPSARIGDGPILRVGDKTSIFTPAATAFCEQVAKQLAKRDSQFVFQRKLMDGGTCESSAFCQFGYDATGICVALGNYHNMNKKTGKIGAEYISLNDYDRMVDWFVALCSARPGYTRVDDALMEKLAGLERTHARRLAQTSKLLLKR